MLELYGVNYDSVCAALPQLEPTGPGLSFDGPQSPPTGPDRLGVDQQGLGRKNRECWLGCKRKVWNMHMEISEGIFSLFPTPPFVQLDQAQPVHHIVLGGTSAIAPG